MGQFHLFWHHLTTFTFVQLRDCFHHTSSQSVLCGRRAWQEFGLQTVLEDPGSTGQTSRQLRDQKLPNSHLKVNSCRGWVSNAHIHCHSPMPTIADNSWRGALDCYNTINATRNWHNAMHTTPAINKQTQQLSYDGFNAKSYSNVLGEFSFFLTPKFWKNRPVDHQLWWKC